jgi:hypothetical protein
MAGCQQSLASLILFILLLTAGTVDVNNIFSWLTTGEPSVPNGPVAH